MSESIEAKLAGIDQRFNDAKTKKTNLKEALDEVDAELYRLQGEYRALKSLQEPDPAKKIEAVPAKVGK